MMRRAALYLSYGSAVSILFSIALSQFLLGLALLTLIISRQRLRFPPIKLPLGLFFAYTVVAVLLSGNVYAGWPQIRKFFVFGIALVIASTFQTAQNVQRLCSLWTATASLSAIVGFGQLLHRYGEAHAQGWGDYGFFLDSRLTGFTSHWMTFGGELMIVLLLAFSFILFSRATRWRAVSAVSLPILATALIFGLTRSIFLVGLPLGILYLVWNWKRWLIGLVPVCIALMLLAAPFQVKERVLSVAKPHGLVDSNIRRVIMIRAGIAMIRAHPWFGLGPEQVGPEFLGYVPKDVPRPLPKGWYGHLHNIYLQYAAERGIPALLLLMWLLVKMVRDLHKTARLYSANHAAWALYGAVAVILALLGEGLFEYNLGNSEVLTMFLAAVACAYVLKWELESRHTSTEARTTIQPAREPVLEHAVEATV